MGDPGNPQHGSDPGSEPGPDQAGWAAPDAPPSPEPQPQAPQQWAAPAPAWGTPPPGGPVPPAAGWLKTGPPVRRRRLTWLWILIPVLVILVASTVVVGIYAVRLAVEPIDATNEYLADVSARRYDEAFDNLCAEARLGTTLSLDRQRELDDQLGPIASYDITGFEFPGDDTSDVIDVITTGTVVRSGITYDIRVGLSRENDEWKVCTTVER